MPTIVELPADDAGKVLPLLAQVQDLHVDARPDIFRGDAPPTEREEFLRQFMAREGVTALACLQQDTAIGYLIYELQERGPSALKQAARVGFLHQVAVDHAHRRRGIATALMEEMKARLRAAGATSLRSEHYAFNIPSAKLMASAGMQPLRITVEGEL